MAVYNFDPEFATTYQTGWHASQTAAEIADMLGLQATDVTVVSGSITTVPDLTAEQEHRLERLVGVFTGRLRGEMAVHSRPPTGSFRITNIWRREDGRIEFEYDDVPM
mgnify:CR=1 FL=1